MKRTRVAACCLILVSFLADCGHDQDHFYATRLDAEKSGEFQRGWLPDFLPRSSQDIHLTYDNSPSEEWCGFQFDPADAEKLVSGLKFFDPHSPPIQRITNPRVRWWPKFLQGDLNSEMAEKAAQAGFSLFSRTRPMFEAENEVLVLAIDRKNGRGYFYGH